MKKAESGLDHGRKDAGADRDGSGGGLKSWKGRMNPVPVAVTPAPQVVATATPTTFHVPWASGRVVRESQALLAKTENTFIDFLLMGNSSNCGLSRGLWTESSILVEVVNQSHFQRIRTEKVSLSWELLVSTWVTGRLHNLLL